MNHQVPNRSDGETSIRQNNFSFVIKKLTKIISRDKKLRIFIDRKTSRALIGLRRTWVAELSQTVML